MRVHGQLVWPMTTCPSCPPSNNIGPFGRLLRSVLQSRWGTCNGTSPWRLLQSPHRCERSMQSLGCTCWACVACTSSWTPAGSDAGLDEVAWATILVSAGNDLVLQTMQVHAGWLKQSRPAGQALARRSCTSRPHGSPASCARTAPVRSAAASHPWVVGPRGPTSYRSGLSYAASQGSMWIQRSPASDQYSVQTWSALSVTCLTCLAA